MNTGNILPLQTFFWSGALSTGDLLGRSGIAMRRFAKTKLQALKRLAPARRSLDPAREAADVRALASNYLQSDPSFAADLYAAAARHEQSGGV